MVLSGGGSNGAYEAGVLWGFTHYGDPNDFEYDVVSGVSVGSINGAILVGYPKGKIQQSTERLSDFWLNLKSKDVW